MRLLFILLLSSNFSFAQKAKSVEYFRLFKEFRGSPRNIMLDGVVKFYAIKLVYKDRKLVEPILYSDNSTDLFKNWVEQLKKVLINSPWDKFIETLESKSDYNIVWTLYFAPDDSTGGKHPLPPSSMAKSIFSIYKLLEGDQDQTYIPPPYYVIDYPTRYKYFGGCSFTPPDSIKVK